MTINNVLTNSMSINNMSTIAYEYTNYMSTILNYYAITNDYGLINDNQASSLSQIMS